MEFTVGLVVDVEFLLSGSNVHPLDQIVEVLEILRHELRPGKTRGQSLQRAPKEVCGRNLPRVNLDHLRSAVR